VSGSESDFETGKYTQELSRYQQYQLRKRQKQKQLAVEQVVESVDSVEERAPSDRIESAPERPVERVVAVRRKRPIRVFAEK